MTISCFHLELFSDHDLLRQLVKIEDTESHLKVKDMYHLMSFEYTGESSNLYLLIAEYLVEHLI